MKFSNGLTPAQAERLALLAEECGEVIQAIGKVLRHGYESTHTHLDGGPTNRENLDSECGDVRYAIMLLARSGDLKEAPRVFRCPTPVCEQRVINFSAEE